MSKDLISREALKISFKEHCCGECDCCVHQKEGFSCELIDNAPTVEEVSVIEFKEPLPLVKAQKIVKALSERPQGEWSSFINGETGWTDAKIIAWQALPEPYESEAKDGR